MRHFILFIAAIFLGLFMALLNRPTQKDSAGAIPVLRVFGYSSFTGRWGAGPLLKEAFEKNCHCKVEFIEGSDSGILLQRLRIEGESLGADLVIGLDQFDLSKALAEQKWQQLKVGQLDTYEAVKSTLPSKFFMPYDWGALSFVARKGELSRIPNSLDDLLLPEYRKKIALEDPRTSSPGMQFLFWVIKSKGEEEGFKYLGKMMEQAHSFSPSWSTAYGLFTNKQAQLAFSYVTSPIYHEIEEKKKDYFSLKFNEALPVQFEFMGVPEFCHQCDLAGQFVNFILSPEGQKIIMEKNLMFPVLKGVLEKSEIENSVFQSLSGLQKFEIPSTAELERLLKRWAEVRRGVNN